MTKSDDAQNPSVDGRDDDVLAVRESSAVTERLKTTTCAWCGESVAYAGVGRRPKYCSDVHRRRASELRTAQRRADRPVDEGGRTTEPQREVVERVETRTRTVVRRGPAKVRTPETTHEWTAALYWLRLDIRAGRFGGDTAVLARSLEETLSIAREEQTARPSGPPVPPKAKSARPQGSKKKRRKRR
ncbi:hypothetical protein [Streptomyces niveus]|uniref:hypothetical protein n=1 Tax=Streptomyces niveus TaxID=193462 RepID=UPI0034360382